MNKLEALKELAEKVEAGTLDWHYCGVQHVHGIGMNKVMWEAYNGSLDAAKALHESVLTGCSQYSIETDPTCLRVIVSWWPEWLSGNREIQGVAWHEDNPARAWLLAIIRALIAQEKAL